MPETNYFWDPLSDNILQERDENGALTAEYTTEPGLYGNIISHIRNGVERQNHNDTVGSVQSITDDNQNVTDSFAYSAFGENTERTGTSVTPLQFVGQSAYYASICGYYSVRRRAYSPLHGRWLSIDPLFRAIDTYRYVRANPIRFVDPSGTMAESKCPAQAGPPPILALGGIQCIDGKLVPVLLDLWLKVRKLPPLDPCIKACILVHESVHVEQIDKVCPDWCKCPEHDKKTPVPPPGSDLSAYECPAHYKHRDCLLNYLRRGGIGCDRGKIVEQILQIDEMAGPYGRLYRCLPWRLPLTDEDIHPPPGTPVPNTPEPIPPSSRQGVQAR